MKKQVFIREWVVIGIIISLMASFIVISQISRIQAKDRLANFQVQQSQEKLEIELSGEVKTPGMYSVSPGTNLKKLLQEVGLTKKADRKTIDFKKVIYSSQKIEIRAKEKS